MTDLLTGNPARRITSFCVPLLIGNLFQQLYSMADSVIIGKYMNTQAFAAVSSTGSLNFLVIGFVLGLCSGFAIPVAQDFGAGDMRGVRRAIASCVWLGVLMTGVLTAAMYFLTDDVLRLLDTPPDLFDYAYDYIHVIFVGMGTTMLYNMLACILRAVGDSKTPLYFLIVACLLNIVLDILFVAVIKMGVAGAAYATLVAQLASGLLCLLTVKKKFPHLALKKEDMGFDAKYAVRLLKNGVPMGLQFSITAIGSVTLTKAVNGLGTAAVAAMGASGRVSGLLACPLDSLGIAMATFSGQNLGAKQIGRVRQGVRQMMGIGFAYCVVACLTCVFFGKNLAMLFISANEVQVLTLTEECLTINSLFYPFLLIIYVFRNTVQGLGFSKDAMLAGLFELVGRCVVAFWLVEPYGFTAACYASPAAWVAADVLLLTLYAMKMGELWRWDQARLRAEQMRAALKKR